MLQLPYVNVRIASRRQQFPKTPIDIALQEEGKTLLVPRGALSQGLPILRNPSLPIDRPCASPRAHSEYYHTHTNQKYQAVPECARLSQKSGTHCARVSHVLNQTARWRRSKWSTGLRCNGWDAASLQERSRVLQVYVSRREPFCCTFDCIHGYITRIA